MARRLRCEIVFDGCSFHVTWRCHNRKWLLGPKWAKRLYYGLLLISNTYFIGNPDWVKEEYEKMMSEIKAKREERNKKKNKPPPDDST